MRVDNFSLLIPEGRERDSGHVELPHGAVYRLKLGNHCHSRRCDAVVAVDGKEVGCFRLERGATIILERPANDHGKFTFFRSDSEEAAAAGAASIATDVRGLIQVEFKPEKPPVVRSILDAVPIVDCFGSPKGLAGTPQNQMSFGAEKTCGGITGLTGHSGQSFYTVAPLDYDPDAAVTISIRLICAAAIRPLAPVTRGNPVPAALE